MPPGWDVDLSDDYEWVPLRLPPDVTRVTASTRLSIEAEYRGWELTRVRLYTDGTRRVLLRRKKTRVDNPTGRRSAGAVDEPTGSIYAALRRAMFLVPPSAVHVLVFAAIARCHRPAHCADTPSTACWRPE